MTRDKDGIPRWWDARSYREYENAVREADRMMRVIGYRWCATQRTSHDADATGVP